MLTELGVRDISKAVVAEDKDEHKETRVAVQTQRVVSLRAFYSRTEKFSVLEPFCPPLSASHNVLGYSNKSTTRSAPLTICTQSLRQS